VLLSLITPDQRSRGLRQIKAEWAKPDEPDDDLGQQPRLF
jgi:hypothetical protein